jgi:excisionase family DNA binding protein
MRDVLTTGQVAQLCGVAPRTVVQWFDSGNLDGYRVPGSSYRRIPRESLVRFCKEHGMPLQDVEGMVTSNLLLVGVPGHVRKGLEELLSSSFDLWEGSSLFDVGYVTGSVLLQCVVLDASLGENVITWLARRFCNEDEKPVLILLAEEYDATQYDGVFDEVFRKPFDPAMLAEQIQKLVEEE